MALASIRPELALLNKKRKILNKKPYLRQDKF